MLAPGDEGPLTGLGPEPGSEAFATLESAPALRNVISPPTSRSASDVGIGRGWGDDILHRAHLSPFVSFSSLSPDERESLLSAARGVLDEALALERTREGGLSEAKLGGQFKVHGRAEEPCPTCGDTLCRIAPSSRTK